MLRSIALVMCIVGISGCATSDQPILNANPTSTGDCKHLYLGTGLDPSNGFGYHGAPAAKAQAECMKNLQKP